MSPTAKSVRLVRCVAPAEMIPNLLTPTLWGIKRYTLGNNMNPATLQKVLSAAGLFFDLVGAGLLAVDVVRRFHGIKLLALLTYGDLSSPPKESPEFKAWEKTNLRFNIWGLGFLLLGFGLQLLALFFQACP